MAVLNREDFLARIKERIGEATDDATIAFVADMTDTFDSFGSNEWEEKYNSEHDAHEALRREYLERFFKGNEPKDEPGEIGAEDITFNDIFKED